jgi:hypothetical protein
VFFGTYIILNYAEGSIWKLVATGMKKANTEIELETKGLRSDFSNRILTVRKG